MPGANRVTLPERSAALPRAEEGRCRGPGRAVSGQRHLHGVESILEPTFHSVLIILQGMQDLPFSFYRWEVQRDAAICSGSRKP